MTWKRALLDWPSVVAYGLVLGVFVGKFAGLLLQRVLP